MKHAVASGQEGLAPGDQSRAVDGALLGLVGPGRLAVGAVEGVQRGVVGAEKDEIAREVGAARDGGIDLDAPALAPLDDIQAPEGAVLVADVDRSVENAGSGLERATLELPLLLSGRKVEGVQVVIIAADVGHAVDDGGG